MKLLVALGACEFDGPDAVSNEIDPPLVGERLQLEAWAHLGLDLGSDLQEPTGAIVIGFALLVGVLVGLDEGEGGAIFGDDPAGRGGAAADVEVKLDGVRVWGGGGFGFCGVLELEGAELGVDGVEGRRG